MREPLAVFDLLTAWIPYFRRLIGTLRNQIVTLFEFLDELMGLGYLGCLNHLLLGSSSVLVSNIIDDAACEQYWLLEDDSHLGSEVIQIILFDVFPIDTNLP